MCIKLHVHVTSCETRDLILLNPLTGVGAYHPMRLPKRCNHYNPVQDLPCRSHGTCCALTRYTLCLQDRADKPCLGFQHYHQVFKPEDTHLFQSPQSLHRRLVMSLPQPEYVRLAFIRRNFFDAGARAWKWRNFGQLAIDHEKEGKDGNPRYSLERCHKEWKKEVDNMAKGKKKWDVEAGQDIMERCPSTALGSYIFRETVQFAPEAYIGFPVKDGAPSVDLTEATRLEFAPPLADGPQPAITAPVVSGPPQPAGDQSTRPDDSTPTTTEPSAARDATTQPIPAVAPTDPPRETSSEGTNPGTLAAGTDGMDIDGVSSATIKADVVPEDNEMNLDHPPVPPLPGNDMEFDLPPLPQEVLDELNQGTMDWMDYMEERYPGINWEAHMENLTVVVDDWPTLQEIMDANPPQP